MESKGSVVAHAEQRCMCSRACVCVVVNAFATCRGHDKRRNRAQVEVHVYVCIVVGGRATDYKHGRRSRGVEVLVWAYFYMHSLGTTYSRYEKRIGSAGRGTSTCLFSCGWAGYGM